MPFRHLGITPELANAIVASVHTPLVVLDSAHHILGANPAFYSTFQLTRTEAEGKHLESLADGGWNIRQLRAHLDDLFSRGAELDDYEVEHDIPTIGRRTMLLTARRISETRNRDARALLAIEDVTDRRRLDGVTRRYTTELERSNKALEEFAHIASHDLQEPLRKIVMFGDRLAETAGAALDDRSRDYLDRMLNSTRRMQHLIDGLLQYSRVTTRGRPFERVDLGAVAADVLRDLENAVERTGATVRCGTLPVIDADALQMRQLIQNLIANALKFHAPGVTPTVDIAARVLDDGERVEISVRDDGIGIAPEHAERIFGVFRQLNPRTEFEGSGIGLAICKRIVERHRGTIRARPNPEGGTTFVATLPVHHVPDPVTPTPAEGRTE